MVNRIILQICILPVGVIVELPQPDDTESTPLGSITQLVFAFCLSGCPSQQKNKAAIGITIFNARFGRLIP